MLYQLSYELPPVPSYHKTAVSPALENPHSEPVLVRWPEPLHMWWRIWALIGLRLVYIANDLPPPRHGVLP